MPIRARHHAPLSVAARASAPTSNPVPIGTHPTTRPTIEADIAGSIRPTILVPICGYVSTTVSGLIEALTSYDMDVPMWIGVRRYAAGTAPHTTCRHARLTA